MTVRDRLVALLARHQACDPLEEVHLDRMRALAGEEGDPFDRERDEHFTASGFVTDGTRLLLVFHAGMRRWLQPGGHIEPFDADPEDAARREVAEETGLSGLELLGEGVLDVDVHPVDHGGARHEHFDLRFLFGGVRGVPTPGDGVSAVRWASLDDLEHLGADVSIMRAARRALPGAS